MDDLKERLLKRMADGEKLEPVTRIRALKAFSPSSVCRFCIQGRLPAVKLGGRFLTHEVEVLEALRRSTRPATEPAKKASRGTGEKDLADAGEKAAFLAELGIQKR